MARKLCKRYLPSTDAILNNRLLRILGPRLRHPNLSLGDTLLIGLFMQCILFAAAGYLAVRLSWRMRVVHEWLTRQTRRA